MKTLWLDRTAWRRVFDAGGDIARTTKPYQHTALCNASTYPLRDNDGTVYNAHRYVAVLK
jgi:hypothetical protein